MNTQIGDVTNPQIGNHPAFKGKRMGIWCSSWLRPGFESWGLMRPDKTWLLYFQCSLQHLEMGQVLGGSRIPATLVGDPDEVASSKFLFSLFCF